jgi:hypothetical protein
MSEAVIRPDETNRIYLGNGVYLSFDGYNIWLRTPREFDVHEIAIERPLWAALKHYIERHQAAFKEGS